jgi:hypothetical protein
LQRFHSSIPRIFSFGNPPAVPGVMRKDIKKHYSAQPLQLNFPCLSPGSRIAAGTILISFPADVSSRPLEISLSVAPHLSPDLSGKLI